MILGGSDSVDEGGGDSAKLADVPSEDCFGFDLLRRAEDEGVVDLATGQREIDSLFDGFSVIPFIE